jgi:hypothetical protein
MAPAQPYVTVIIPTRGRPASLARAVRSLFRQSGIDLSKVELVVVDNDAGGGAEPVAARLAASAPLQMQYLCEPEPGVASARNAGLAKAGAKMIAFLDDDEEASCGWLAGLLAVQARFDADVVFGPVRGRAPERLESHRDYLEQFFSREGPAEAQMLDGYFGCGCSLIRRSALPEAENPFALSQNQFGGEDDLLFQAMKAQGVRFAWAPEAWVWEHPDPDRLTLGYAIRRAFSYGQGPSRACLARNPPDLPGIAYWMAVGAGQALVFGVMAMLKWIAHAPDRAFALDRAARGLGKLLWFSPFKRKFYGLP